ncbi:unnamed protein product [Urochloa decumbens]|uniref:F-box domain-containing protein n=1 Tax=Urochloa decumbens TaxID=240449 RepID=A0ABC9G8X2_9POAL
MGNQLAAIMASRHPRTPSRANAAGDGIRISNGGVLPRDVLFEVLLCLPANQLLRGPRAVCRLWRSLLSDPLFIAAHAARHPDRLVVVSTCAVFDQEADVELLDTPSGRVVRRVARCAGTSYPRNPPMRAHQGLVLVAGNGQPLRVVDPYTGAISVLPPEDPGHREAAIAASVSVLGRAALVDDGLEDKAGEYKVFSISTVDRDHYHCKVLTLGGSSIAGDVGAWRKADKPPDTVRCDKPWVAAVTGGVVYVLAFHRRDQIDWVAAFDLDTEQWSPNLIQGPPASMAVSSLAEMDGRLVAVTGTFFSGSGVASSSSVHLWVLMGCSDSDDDGGEHEALWEEMCTVPRSGIQWKGHNYEKVEEPVWVLNGGMVAFVVWSLVHAGGVPGERGCQDWVLRVYDPRRGLLTMWRACLTPPMLQLVSAPGVSC